jgi:hypothetical protein
MTVLITNNASHIFQDVYFAACIAARKHAFEVLGVFDGTVGIWDIRNRLILCTLETCWRWGADIVTILRVSVKSMLRFPAWSSHAELFHSKN